MIPIAAIISPIEQSTKFSRSEDVLAGALTTAWKLRVQKNAAGRKKSASAGSGRLARKRSK